MNQNNKQAVNAYTLIKSRHHPNYLHWAVRSNLFKLEITGAKNKYKNINKKKTREGTNTNNINIVII